MCLCVCACEREKERERERERKKKRERERDQELKMLYQLASPPKVENRCKIYTCMFSEDLENSQF